MMVIIEKEIVAQVPVLHVVKQEKKRDDCRSFCLFMDLPARKSIICTLRICLPKQDTAS